MIWAALLVLHYTICVNSPAHIAKHSDSTAKPVHWGVGDANWLALGPFPDNSQVRSLAAKVVSHFQSKLFDP